jgi:hypothetical protein
MYSEIPGIKEPSSTIAYKLLNGESKGLHPYLIHEIYCSIDEGEGKKNLCFSRNYHFGPDISAFGCFKKGLRTLNEKIDPVLFFESWCPLAMQGSFLLPREDDGISTYCH